MNRSDAVNIIQYGRLCCCTAVTVESLSVLVLYSSVHMKDTQSNEAVFSRFCKLNLTCIYIVHCIMHFPDNSLMAFYHPLVS